VALRFSLYDFRFLLSITAPKPRLGGSLKRSLGMAPPRYEIRATSGEIA